MLGVGFGLLLIPLYRVARRIADRIVYGRRATPYEVLTAFSGRIGETYASDDVLARMAQVLAAGTGATRTRVLVRVGERERAIASHGDGPGEETRTPVHFQGEELGAIAVTMPANDPMDPAKERLVRDLAAQAGPVLHNVRLLEELRASRQRLVEAQDEERRKLERNIHDGVQQQLVALAVQLEARRHAGGSRPGQGRTRRSPHCRPTPARPWRTCAISPAGSTRRCSRTRGWSSALEAQARKAAVPTTSRPRGRALPARRRVHRVLLHAGGAQQRREVRRRDAAPRSQLAQDDGHMLRSASATTARGSIRRSRRTGPDCRAWPTGSTRSAASLTVTSAPGSGTTVTGRVPRPD